MSSSLGRPIVWALLAALVPAAATAAQPKVGDRFGDWTLECRAVTAESNICAITQTMVTQPDQKRVLKLTFGRLGPGNELTLYALGPLGIDLPAGLAARVDEGPPFRLTPQTCTNQGCESTATIDAALVKALRAGTSLHVGFRAFGRTEPITMRASLKGISSGFKAIGEK